jgi:putative transposase
MPTGLRRIQGGGDFHFITCSCYRRQQFLGSLQRRDLFLKILEEVRKKYNFIVVGYVVIHPTTRTPRVPGAPVLPEHFHTLVGEPKTKPLSVMMQVLKQRVSQRSRRRRESRDQMRLWATESAPAFWQPRYYDFNVYSGKKKKEKLRYMHRAQ